MWLSPWNQYRSKSAPASYPKMREVRFRHMKTQSQATHDVADKSRQPTPQAVALVKPSVDWVDLSQQSAGLTGGSIEGQAARLSHPHLQIAQRQMLAAQIGRVQGNRHLQQVFASTKSDGTSNTPKPPSPDWRMPLPPGARMVDSGVQHVAQRQLASMVSVPNYRLAQSWTVQRAWTRGGVNQVLKQDKTGKDTVTDLNSQGYTVLHFDKYEFQRQFYTDSAKTIKDGPPNAYTMHGWHSRSKKEIAMEDLGDKNRAASTLVHEVAHANQHKANEKAKLVGGKQPFADVLSKEIDSHIRQELFNRAAGIPPVDKSWRALTGDKLKNAVTTYVERVYAVGKGSRPYTDTVPKYNILETIKPWPPIV